MSNEIWTTFDEGNNLYALIWRKSNDLVWNNTDSQFDTYTDVDIDKYDVPLANQVDSDYYTVDFPAAITGTDPIAYRVQIMLRPGAIDADADFGIAQMEIIWDGSKEVDIGTVFNTTTSVTNVYNEEINPSPITVIDETLRA